MKKYFILLILICCYNLSAQKKSNIENITLEGSFLDKSEFKVGYFGDFIWNSGIAMGAEYLWREKIRTKEKQRRTKIITKQWLLKGTFGIRYDHRVELGVFTNYGIVWRRTNTKGKQVSILFSPLGYYRSFLGETYQVSGDNVDRVFAAGRNYYAPSISFGIGKFRKGKKLTATYINVTYLLRLPHNTTYLPTYAIEFGYRFKFKKKNKYATIDN